MRPDLYATFDAERPYSAKSVAKLVGKIHALLENHTRRGHAHFEIGQAMRIAVAHMVINASQHGFGSLDEMKRMACEDLANAVDACWGAEHQHMAARATVSDVGRA